MLETVCCVTNWGQRKQAVTVVQNDRTPPNCNCKVLHALNARSQSVNWQKQTNNLASKKSRSYSNGFFSHDILSNFSVIVRKKSSTALVMFSGFFNFSTFISTEDTCSVECTFPCLSFFIMLYVVFLLLLDFATSLLQHCFLPSFIIYRGYYSTACNILLLLNNCCSWWRCIASLYICMAFLFM